jgi:predicted membrane channel-forming protein YqfA (hemolysin III family)
MFQFYIIAINQQNFALHYYLLVEDIMNVYIFLFNIWTGIGMTYDWKTKKTLSKNRVYNFICHGVALLLENELIWERDSFQVVDIFINIILTFGL